MSVDSRYMVLLNIPRATGCKTRLLISYRVSKINAFAKVT